MFRLITCSKLILLNNFSYVGYLRVGYRIYFCDHSLVIYTIVWHLSQIKIDALVIQWWQNPCAVLTKVRRQYPILSEDGCIEMFYSFHPYSTESYHYLLPCCDMSMLWQWSTTNDSSLDDLFLNVEGFLNCSCDVVTLHKIQNLATMSTMMSTKWFPFSLLMNDDRFGSERESAIGYLILAVICELLNHTLDYKESYSQHISTDCRYLVLFVNTLTRRCNSYKISRFCSIHISVNLPT